MKYLMKIKMPNDTANDAIRDPQFGKKMNDLLAEVKAEAAYFSTVRGQRGGYVVVNLNDASEIPKIAEPFFLWLNADIDFIPVMLLSDLEKAGPSIGEAVKKWG